MTIGCEPDAAGRGQVRGDLAEPQVALTELAQLAGG